MSSKSVYFVWVFCAILVHFPLTNCKIVTIFQPDGEVIVKVQFRNLTIVQTSADGYNLMQASNGTSLITFWSFEGEVLNCNYETGINATRNFEKEFGFETSNRNTSSYSSATYQDIEAMPTAVYTLARNGIPVEKCQEFQNEIKKFSRSGGQRRKRDLMLFPGTNWCGSGYSGKDFKQLGHNAVADRCCRDHDHCKHTIAPFTTKYHYLNYRFHTISHCKCDERFRSCLRLGNTGATNLIGKLFFNVVKTKCFVLKKEKICKKRNWWGTCIKKRKTRRAYIRDPLSY